MTRAQTLRPYSNKIGVAEWKYEFTFFDIIEEPFFAPNAPNGASLRWCVFART